MRPSNHGKLETRRCDSCRCAWHLMAGPDDLRKLLEAGTISPAQAPNQLKCPACAAELIPIGNNYRSELACRICRACGGVLLDAPRCPITDAFDLKRLSLTLFLTLRSRVGK